MKNKLQEKLIAILLVFAIVFLTVPLAKADVIVSLDENEKTVNTGFAVANAGQTRGTYNISYWYSNSNSVGYWSSTPTVYYCKLSGTSYFSTAIPNGVTKWRNALGIPVYSVSTDNDESDYMNTNQIQFYQGTNAELKSLYLFSDDDIDDSSVYGLTSYKSQSLTHTLNKNGTSYNCYTHYRVRGFIRDFGSNTTKYNSVCAHEIGHALGWKGHSSNSSDIMYPSYQGVTTLTDRDKYHLKQVYDLF